MREQSAVSEVTGYILAFGIVTAMAIFVFYSSYPYAVSLFQESRIKIAETQMSLVDYSTSLCALGDSPYQTVKFNLNGASVWVEEGGNRVEIYPVFNGVVYSKPIYNGSIGRIVAKYGDVLIGYEGGGVWEKRGNGVSMITPPEFHFKVDTLTLPLIKIVGNGSAGGYGTVPVTIEKVGTKIIYPNISIDPNFTNPLTCDYLILKIQSDFYLGWERYFQERSDAEVLQVFPENNTLYVQMATRPAPIFRAYEVPLEIRRLDYTNQTPIEDFEVDFQGLSSSLDLVWRTYTDPELIIIFKKVGPAGSNTIRIGVAYGNSSQYEVWVSEEPIYWNTSTDSVLVDLLSSEINMTYGSASFLSPPPTGYSSLSTPVSPTITWGYDINVTDSGDFSSATKPLGEIVQHYFRVLAIQSSPDITLYEDERTSTSKGFNPELTTYRLLYRQIPPVITFLHIAEHQIKINIG